MKKMSKTIVFFGSGPVAASSLQKLLAWADVEMVITKRRPPHHKDPAPVETIATKLKLNLQFADNKQQLEQLILTTKPSSAVGLVIDYGVIITSQTISYFPLGIVNSHFSLLPEWRGADPISYSILSGQPKTGVTLITINKGLDTGPILAQHTMPLLKSYNNQQLTHKLVNLSDTLLSKNLPGYISKKIGTTPQPAGAIATYSRMLTKQDGTLNLNKPATVLAREIKAFSSWPKCKLTLKSGEQIVITSALATNHQLELGQINTPNKQIIVGCRVGSLEITRLKLAGKTEVDSRSFLNGYSHLLSAGLAIGRST
jgi:methionyl-tRNA formyltransferase